MSDETSSTEYLGRVIASLRTAQGLKRMDLKTRSGLSYPYIAEIENGGKKSPSLKAIAALAAALGVTPAELQARAEELEAADRGNPRSVSIGREAYDVAQGSRLQPPHDLQPMAMMTSAPDLTGDDTVARITERVLDALGPRLRDVIANEVSYAVREELLRQREGH